MESSKRRINAPSSLEFEPLNQQAAHAASLIKTNNNNDNFRDDEKPPLSQKVLQKVYVNPVSKFSSTIQKNVQPILSQLQQDYNFTLERNDQSVTYGIQAGRKQRNNRRDDASGKKKKRYTVQMPPKQMIMWVSIIFLMIPFVAFFYILIGELAYKNEVSNKTGRNQLKKSRVDQINATLTKTDLDKSYLINEWVSHSNKNLDLKNLSVAQITDIVNNATEIILDNFFHGKTTLNSKDAAVTIDSLKHKDLSPMIHSSNNINNHETSIRDPSEKNDQFSVIPPSADEQIELIESINSLTGVSRDDKALITDNSVINDDDIVDSEQNDSFDDAKDNEYSLQQINAVSGDQIGEHHLRSR